MDIYFCDLCGARVTDLDLRGGHGMRRQFDVICAGCVEMGQGKNWLTGSQQREQLKQRDHQRKAGGSATDDLRATAVVAPVADFISKARDRARTVEDGINESNERVKSTPVASHPVASQIAASDELMDQDDLSVDYSSKNAAKINAYNKADIAEEVAGELAADAPDAADAPAGVQKPAPAMNNHFATAASSFSALSNPPRKKSTDAEDIEPTETDNELSDDADDADDSDDLNEKGQTKPTTPSERGAKMIDKSSHSTAQKPQSGSVANPRAGAPSANKTSGAKTSSPTGKSAVSSSSPGNATRASSAGNSARANNNKGMSSKGTPKASSRNKASQKNKQIIILSCISVGILVLLSLIIFGGSSKPKQNQEALPPINLSDNLKSAVTEAKAAARSALGTKKPDELKAAKAKIQAIQPQIYVWADEAKKGGYKDEEVEHALDIVGFPDVQSLIRNINDELMKQKNH